MNDSRDVISIAANHIEAGIKKYQGCIDAHLVQVVASAGLKFTPYRFNDGRILLVLPHNCAAFLYADSETLYKNLNLQ